MWMGAHACAKLNLMHNFSLVFTAVKPDLHNWRTLHLFLKITVMLLNACFMPVPSVVFLFVGLLGSHGVLCDCGQRRSGHAGRLHDLDILAGQTRHQLLAWRTARKEELVGHSSQYATDHWSEPINLKVGERLMRNGIQGLWVESPYIWMIHHKSTMTTIIPITLNKDLAVKCTNKSS